MSHTNLSCINRSVADNLPNLVEDDDDPEYWILDSFPTDYLFTTHHSTNRSTQPRTDPYVFGATSSSLLALDFPLTPPEISVGRYEDHHKVPFSQRNHPTHLLASLSRTGRQAALSMPVLHAQVSNRCKQKRRIRCLHRISYAWTWRTFFIINWSQESWTYFEPRSSRQETFDRQETSFDQSSEA